MGQWCCKCCSKSNSEDIHINNQDEIPGLPREPAPIAPATREVENHFERNQPINNAITNQPLTPQPIQQPERMLVVGMYCFVARGPTELSFKKGDLMEVLQQSVSDAGHGYSLSLRSVREPSYLARIKHFRICTAENTCFFITRTKVFQTLNDLVEYYMSGHDATELGRTMRYPCERPLPGMYDMGKATKDKWEIDRSSLQFKKELGHGSFGDVWLGTWNNDVEVAIKLLKEGTMSTEAFLDEARIMKSLRHPNILVLYAVCTTEEPILIITEYMLDGALLEFLRNDSGQKIFFHEQTYMGAQVAAGMQYLEAKQLIHRDLAARNVLVGPSLTCKVADFGLARICDGGEYNMRPNTKFPIKWTAPEAFLHNYFTIKSDVWSFGILMMEIITYGAVPYPGMGKQEVIDNVQNGFRMGKPANCPDPLYELMYSCWKANPEERPTFERLHEFLDNYDIEAERSYYGPQLSMQ
ncbi:Tyrosine-protein kinase Src64B-like 1 [Homarus americanus]|uniref:non-specific protein-tyrosine kinase n=1 Tax=Homarus americanus TaxID=6706 RepID=A0A8J5NBH1_HOMAM|nr:Tyrosine-protein kinase Src64B-like 1 [Homarus americanus]